MVRGGKVFYRMAEIQIWDYLDYLSLLGIIDT